MKKICFVVSNSFFVNAFLYEPIKSLSDQYSIYLICNTQNQDNIELKHPNIKKIYSINIKRNIALLNDLKSLIEICEIIKKERFEVVHTLTPKAGLIGMTASYLMGVRNRFHTFTGQVWVSKKGLFKYLLINLDRIVIRLSSQIIVDGISQKEFLIEKGLLKKYSAEVFNNVSTCGINLEKFKPNFLIRQKERLKYKVSKTATVFLYLGRLNLDKGIKELVESFLMLDREDSFLFLVGPLEMDITNNMIKKYRLKNIVFLPYTNTPQNILQICDVFCFPSHREGFGYSIIEALAIEKPVICSDIYGLKYTSINNVTGLKHEVKSRQNLLEKMRFAIDNPHIMKQMGKNGRAYVKENFKEEKVIEKWREFYNRFV